MCASAGTDPWRCVAVELIIYCSITSSSNRATNNNFTLHRFLSWISKAACCRKCVAYNVCIFAGASKEFSFCFGRILFSRERVVARRRFLCVIYDGSDAYFIRLEQRRRGLCAARANNAARFKKMHSLRAICCRKSRKWRGRAFCPHFMCNACKPHLLNQDDHL